ncbi:4-alpha-L-fucosyltransferase [Gonapodya sp. JEL0774]|nr:4-alpha-L-fucosyltransferase [Gonapodya sp. JEL0774]
MSVIFPRDYCLVRVFSVLECLLRDDSPFGMEPQGWPALTRNPSSYSYIVTINNPANIFPDIPPPGHIIHVTYPDHVPSDFQTTFSKYDHPTELEQMRFAESYTGNRETPVVLYMSTRCEWWRDEWVKRLMAQGIAVVSTGRCITTQNANTLFPECINEQSINGGHPEMRKSKMCLMQKFKFTLAIDNTLEPDYVTEKLFDPLRAQTLPVYLGAPNSLSEYSVRDMSWNF